MRATEQDRVRQIIEDDVLGNIGGRAFGFNEWDKTIRPMDYGDPDKPNPPTTGSDLGHSAARGGQCYDQLLG
jgi:hypothetical protein